MPEELPDETTLMMLVLFDIRTTTDYIIDLLVDDDGEEEAGDTRTAGGSAGARGPSSIACFKRRSPDAKPRQPNGGVPETTASA